MSARLEELEDAVDRDLIERHLAGDRAAFTVLHDRYRPRLERYIRSRVSQDHAAEDLAQETFARALASVGGLRERERFYPWLTVIARHLVVEYYRAKAKLYLQADMEGEAPASPLDSELLRRENQEELERALGRVRPRHREILQMRERDEMSYEDIAKRLGTPATTIPPLLFRARQALRREYFAMIERDDAARAALLPALMAAWRRLRYRAGQYAAWLPDVNALCASATCIAVGVGSLLLPSDDVVLTPEQAVTRDSVTTRESADAAAALEGQAGSFGQFGGALGSPRATASPPPTKYVSGVAEISIDNPERERWGRERAREMPIYHEFGPVWFSADPEQFQRDMESTLAGDPQWMEGTP